MWWQYVHLLPHATTCQSSMFYHLHIMICMTIFSESILGRQVSLTAWWICCSVSTSNIGIHAYIHILYKSNKSRMQTGTFSNLTVQNIMWHLNTGKGYVFLLITRSFRMRPTARGKCLLAMCLHLVENDWSNSPQHGYLFVGSAYSTTLGHGPIARTK